MTDRIEKQILLRAPRSRVWRALTDVKEFGTWFRCTLDGEFAVGKRLSGKVTYPGSEHLKMELVVERMDAEELFSFRWPHGGEPDVDYSNEPHTLVELRLQEVPEGTLLTVVESGFDQLPPELRHQAFRSNTEGWAIQLENIKAHVSD